MSGHSKWATIKRHKAAVDAKRGKIFSRMSKELTLAAREGGGDAEMNPRLRTLIDKAKAANMPMDNIDRAIKKGTGELPGVEYEEVVYEGYAPGGVGLIIAATTDNRNRTTSDVRSYFSKYGGKMATSGALATQFQKMGQFFISAENTTEEQLMETVVEAGAEDIRNHGDHFEVLCPLPAYYEVVSALKQAGVEADSSELAYVPLTEVPVSDASTARQVLRLIEMLDELDDVQHVYSNFDIEESLLAEASG